VTTRVVLIEDDVDLALMTRRRLEKTLGVDVVSFHQGQVAVTALREWETPPDLICVDLGLPDISGFQVCTMLRQIVALERVPLLVVSGRSGLDDHARALEVGATSFLPKPFSMRAFLDEVQRLLERSAE